MAAINPDKVGIGRLTVDWIRCSGHGVCAAAIGEQISLDRWGFPDGVNTSGVPIDKDLRSAAQLAVATCPAVALRFVEHQSSKRTGQ